MKRDVSLQDLTPILCDPNFVTPILFATLIGLAGALAVAPDAARATVYLSLDAEEGVAGVTVPQSIFHQDDPPQAPYGGARATYQSSGGAPQGQQYYQWATRDNQLDHYTEIALNNGTPITNIMGHTYYLAYFFRFDRIDGLDIWHEFDGHSYDKLTDVIGSGVRWVIGVGQHTEYCSALNPDHRFTAFVWEGTYRYNPNVDCYDFYRQNSSGYAVGNSLALAYDAWHSAVLALRMAADGTGSVALYIDGTKIIEYDNIQTAATADATLLRLNIGGTLAQTAYDAPRHHRKFDAILFTDNWQDIVNGGYLAPPRGGDTIPPAAPSNLTVQ